MLIIRKVPSNILNFLSELSDKHAYIVSLNVSSVLKPSDEVSREPFDVDANLDWHHFLKFGRRKEELD